MSWWQIVLIPFVPVILLLVGVPIIYVITRIQKRRFLNTRESIEAVQKSTEQSTEPKAPEKIEPLPPELIAEIEENYHIASNPIVGKLVPFQTNVWNINNQHIPDSPSDFKEELVQVYIDVGLANNIVWLSMEFKFRSETLDNQYIKLCSKIITRLDKIMPLLRESQLRTITSEKSL